MSFDRMGVTHEPKKKLTDAELAVQAKMDKKDSVPVVDPVNPHQVGIFLLPGIAGTVDELQFLSSEIIEQDNETHDSKRPVYGYRDYYIYKGWYQKNYMKIEDEAKNIEDELIAKLPKGPYVIVAYSYSSLLAIEIMQDFTAKGLDTFVYIIDAPAPELSQAFLSSKSSAYVQKLLEIVNYTASICSIKNALSLNQQQIEEFKNYAPAKCIDKIAQLVYQENPIIQNRCAFETEINFEKLRFEKLVNYQKVFDKPLPGKIRALITKKTADLYGDKLGGWVDYVKNDKLSFENDKHLLALDHQDLLSEENAGALANSIRQFVDENITEKYLTDYGLLLAVNNLYRKTQQTNDPDLTQAAKNLQQQVIKKCTPPTTPPESENGSPVLSPEVTRQSTSLLAENPYTMFTEKVVTTLDDNRLSQKPQPARRQ